MKIFCDGEDAIANPNCTGKKRAKETTQTKISASRRVFFLTAFGVQTLFFFYESNKSQNKLLKEEEREKKNLRRSSSFEFQISLPLYSSFKKWKIKICCVSFHIRNQFIYRVYKLHSRTCQKCQKKFDMCHLRSRPQLLFQSRGHHSYKFGTRYPKIPNQHNNRLLVVGIFQENPEIFLDQAVGDLKWALLFNYKDKNHAHKIYKQNQKKIMA